MSELKACPFCKCTEIVAGKDYTRGNYRVDCLGCSAFITAPSLELAIHDWNTRPIEDELRAELARLQEKLHDEMSQLEIATDLGNKRWVALNEIYENGEKHNTNWCKRKAQEGLGIK